MQPLTEMKNKDFFREIYTSLNNTRDLNGG